MEKNTHPRDALIEFDAGPHKYTCAGEANYMSVTTWNHTHFKPFDADAVIAKMNLKNPKSKYYGQTPAEIKAGWEKNRDEAAAAGTAMHEAIERYYKGGCPPSPPIGVNGDENGKDIEDIHSAQIGGVHPGVNVDDIRSAQMGGVGVSPRGIPPTKFAQFVSDHPRLKPYRSEWMIFHEELRLAGSIDMVYENANGTLMIYDWKRCKEIKKANSFGEFALTECINHLPDTNYWHYALQLNTYKAILEAKYEKKVTSMCLVGLHPNLERYQLFKVPDLTHEIKALFALRQAQLIN
jgi:hypothetical protein